MRKSDVTTALLSLWILTSCAGSAAKLGVQSTPRDVPCCAGATEDTPVNIEYLGSGGWLITRGTSTILTAPFFSNPSLLRAGMGRLRSDTALVKRETARIPSNVPVVLAGHSHYDHLLDLPLVLDHLTEAVVYSGDTTLSLLASFGFHRAVSVIPYAGTRNNPGTWTTIGSIRFMPFLSEHAAHGFHAKLYNGHYREPPSRPRYAWDWREGEPLAFLIDFLDRNGKTAFRIYYDDTAHDSPYGYPDAQTLNEHRVDVAIICAASFQQTAGYPKELLAYLHPAHVLIGHWEDFFTPYDHRVRTVRLTDVGRFIEEVRQIVGTDAYTLPDRHALIHFTPERKRSQVR